MNHNEFKMLKKRLIFDVFYITKICVKFSLWVKYSNLVKKMQLDSIINAIANKNR